MAGKLPAGWTVSKPYVRQKSGNMLRVTIKGCDSIIPAVDAITSNPASIRECSTSKRMMLSSSATRTAPDVIEAALSLFPDALNGQRPARFPQTCVIC